MLEISNEEFIRLAKYAKDNLGIQLKEEKKVLVSGRLSGVLQALNLQSFSQYLDYIAADRSGVAAKIFANKLTTNHTFFMREAEHFDFFNSVVLPNLVPRLREKDLRIWSAGCSSGEEAYTLAMIIDEFLGKDKLNWDAKLLATDISEEVLSRAARGRYSNETVAPLPRKWLLNYFERYDNEHYEVNRKMKSEVIFRRFNLMSAFPFRKKFHVIFCRNVMIYFDAKTKADLIQRFYDSLEPGGYLFIGHSESINRESTQFRYIMPAVYQK